MVFVHHLWLCAEFKFPSIDKCGPQQFLFSPSMENFYFRCFQDFPMLFFTKKDCGEGPHGEKRFYWRVNCHQAQKKSTTRSLTNRKDIATNKPDKIKGSLAIIQMLAWESPLTLMLCKKASSLKLRIQRWTEVISLSKTFRFLIFQMIQISRRKSKAEDCSFCRIIS